MTAGGQAGRRTGGQVVRLALGALVVLTAPTSAPAALPARPPARLPALMTIGRLHYDGAATGTRNPSSLPTCFRPSIPGPISGSLLRKKSFTLGDEDLWNIPYLHMTGHGNVHFSDP